MEKVEVEFSHHHGKKKPGDRVTLPADEAKALVSAGYALYATQPDAKAAGADTSQAKTARPSGS